MQVEWIAVDWGTTNFRAWAMDRDGDVIAERAASIGMLQLKAGEFQSALLTEISDWLSDGTRTPVIACGMVGAKQGWFEVPYTNCTEAKNNFCPTTRVRETSPLIDVHIVHGLCADDHSSVMRGEETQLLGLLSDVPDFSGLVCLPGTHSKWVSVLDGRISQFETYMTGELFQLLSEKSVLRHSVGDQVLDEQTFSDAVSEAVSEPSIILRKLFSIRAQDLLNKMSPAVLRAQLSGWLVGAEVGLAAKRHEAETVILLSSQEARVRYETACQIAGLKVSNQEATAATLSGLRAIYDQLEAHAA